MRAQHGVTSRIEVPIQRQLVVAACCAAIAVTVVHLVGVAHLAESGGLRLAYLSAQVAFGVFALAAAIVGVLITVLGPPQSPTFLAGLALGVMGVPLLGDGVLSVLDGVRFEPQLRALYTGSASLAFYTSVAATLRFSQTFPKAIRIPAARGSEMALVRVARRAYRTSLEPWLVWLVAGLAVVLAWLEIIDLRPVFAIGVSTGAAVLTLVNFAVAYALAGSAERPRIIWLGEGLLLTALVGVLAVGLVTAGRVVGSPLPPSVLPWLMVSGLFGGLLCVAVAVFYRGALDPQLIVRRTTLYGALGVVAVFTFAGIESFVTEYLTARLRLPAVVGTWFAGGAVALVVGVVHARLKGRVEAVLLAQPPGSADRGRSDET